MMRHARTLRRRRLGGADVHAAIDQRRIDADDLHRQSRRQPLDQCSAQSLLPLPVGPVSTTSSGARRVPAAHQRPRRNSWSSSRSVRRIQVGRP